MLRHVPDQIAPSIGINSTIILRYELLRTIFATDINYNVAIKPCLIQFKQVGLYPERFVPICIHK